MIYELPLLELLEMLSGHVLNENGSAVAVLPREIQVN
jgi:hypothetical protein